MRHTLFAYVDGSDLDGVAADLAARFRQFVQAHPWHFTPKIVNQRHLPEATLAAADLPDWDLGLDMAIPAVGREPFGWFDDCERIVAFPGVLHGVTGRAFVVGIHDSENDVAEDLFWVSQQDPDIKQFRRVFRVPDAAR